MSSRTGEKAGWIGGFAGGFSWVVVLAGVFLSQGKTAFGFSGLCLAVLAGVLIAICAPWRHPTTPAWKLFVPPYLALAAAAVWAILAFGPEALAREGVSPWNLLAAIPLFVPFIVGGKRRWVDGETRITAPSQEGR